MSPEIRLIKAFRIRHSLSQQALADLLGVSVNTVGNWETGATNPPAFLGLALETATRKIRGEA